MTGCRGRTLTIILVAIAAIVFSGCIFDRADRDEGPIADIPFVDGGRYVYEIRANGNPIGEAEFATVRGELDSKPVWIFRNRTDIPASLNEETTVYADADSLEPLRFEGIIEVSKGKYEITAVYGDEIVINARTPEGPQTVKRPKQQGAFDNDQLLMTIRALPLTKGFKTELDLVLPKNANRATINLRVMDQELVTVPAGEFEVWKVQLSVQTVTQYAWYAVNGTRPLVKYDNGNTVFVLTEIHE